MRARNPMSRRRHHDERQEHERWAIPYGDLVTLLLGFFVVMYAMSSVNEGKYRILSDSLNAAFRGAPSSNQPIWMGEPTAPTLLPGEAARDAAIRQASAAAEHAMGPLIAQGLVDIEGEGGKFEISVRSDILFTSGAAALSPAAQQVIRKLGDVLKDFPVDIRVEGHTDDLPIRGGQFPSNWELSAARAASVVHLLTDTGIAPARLAVVAYGEYRPVLPNATPDGRNANRRVVLSVTGSEPAVEEEQ